MSIRLYPKVESKICVSCGNEFKRKKNYYGKAWENTKHCSRQCFGKVLSQIRFKLDEKDHPKWKGNEVGYFGVHDWMTKHYGQPVGCENCGLKDPKRKYHWANLSGQYYRSRDDFRRMCVSCHRKYDYRRPSI